MSTELKSKVFAEGSTFIVFVDCVIGDKDASYCLHAEGNPRVIYRLLKEHKHKLHKDIYYMMRKENVFINHSEEVYELDGEKLYKYYNEGGL